MKRLIAIIITVIILALPVHASADAKGPLSYDRSVSLMNLNNNTLKKLQRAESDSEKQYRTNVGQANTIEIDGVTIQFNGKDIYIPYDPETKVSMRKVKELYPEQMKFSWEAAKQNRIITTNSLQVTLRGVFFGVYNAQMDLLFKQRKMGLAVEINRQDTLKLNNGMITGLNQEESDYNLQKAQKDTDAAKRNYDNAVRNFDQFVGLPANAQFTQAIYEDVLKIPQWKPVEYYIDAALANRFDITSIKKQIDLKEQEKRLTESGYTYKMDTKAQDEYERLLNAIEQLTMKLEVTQLSIKNEIENAYVDVIKTGKGLDILDNTLKLQRSSYTKVQDRYKAGMISKNILTQSELGLLQLENSYKAALYDYNTRIMRFKNATGIGPGY